MKTTTFFTVIGIVILLFIWLAIHPEKVHTGQLVVLAAFCILALVLFPYKAKKRLPRLRPQKVLRWQVDCHGMWLSEFVPMKFYTEKVADAYLHYLLSGLFGRKGTVSKTSITPDRAHNPILVITKRKLELWEQFMYIRKKKDGRERTFRPSEQNCTSLLPKDNFENTDLWARNTNNIRGRRLSRYLSSN